MLQRVLGRHARFLETPDVALWWVDHPGSGGSTTVIDQSDVVRLQVEHLLERGYRRLAYLALESSSGQRFIDVRARAFTDVCRSHGVSSAPVAVEPSQLEAVVARLRSWRARSKRPLGICAWSDVTALAVLNAARVLDLAVPDDVGVIGVDDTISAQLAWPALSSVRLDVSQEAAQLAHQVTTVLGLDEPRPRTDEPVQVVARAST